MSAQWALARRPETLDALAGDDPQVDALRNDVRQGRFRNVIIEGPSGAGKSTLGMAYMKAGTCLKPLDSGSSCNDCVACTALAQGHSRDCRVVDCHRDGGKDDIHFLLEEELACRPWLSSRQIVLMDEADGLSRGARDALLVPLQEIRFPVTFIFTCIDADVLRGPLRDRCRVIRLDIPTIESGVAFLTGICREEGIRADHDALTVLAELSRGYRQLLENLETLASLTKNRSIDVTSVRSVFRDRSAHALDYVAALADGCLDRQLAALAAMNVAPGETVRAVRDILRFTSRRVVR